MQYLLLIYTEPGGGALVTEPPTPEEMGAMLAEYGAYGAWLRETGRFVAGEALEDVSTATSVRVRDGRTITTDGPFAETKEVLGGFYIVEAEDLDQAIEAAARIPGARVGTIEVRPIVDFSKLQAAEPAGASAAG